MADLRGSDLSYANLNEANLEASDLTSANVLGASLLNANLVGVDLSYSDLTHTDFTGAQLHQAHLSRVRHLPASMRKARLFSPSDFGEQPSYSPESVKSISNLMEETEAIRDLSDEAMVLYFRGESKCGWELRPSVMRPPFSPQAEAAMLVDLVSKRPEEFNNAGSPIGHWVLAQHHGLKTRFLDITRNPLVALFHASEVDPGYDGRLHVFGVPPSLINAFNTDTVTVVANFAKLSDKEQHSIIRRDDPSLHQPAWPPRYTWESLYQYGSAASTPIYADRLRDEIQLERSNFQQAIDPRDLYRVFVVEPQQSSDRIRAQSGAFLVSAFHERFERQEILEWNADMPLYTHFELTIPSEDKVNIIGELRLLNVTRETLFPGMDTSAAAVTEYYAKSPIRTRDN